MKKFLFIFKTNKLQPIEEGLELLLALSAFTDQISVFFTKDGKQNLNSNKSFNSLVMFGITKIYTDETAVEKDLIADHDVIIPI